MLFNFFRDFFDVLETHFPSSGSPGEVYVADVGDYSQHMDTVAKIGAELSALDSLKEGSVDGSFHLQFEKFVREVIGVEDYPEAKLERERFQSYLAEFLHTDGMGYKTRLEFRANLTCAAEAPELKLIKIPYQHKA